MKSARRAVEEVGLAQIVGEIRACRACAPAVVPRPVLRASPTARLCIVSQAPGTKVHASGVPFTDASGDRLRSWLGVTPEEFYDESRVAIIPMGFCFPGQNEKGADLPPRRECAPLWRDRLFGALPQMRLTLLIGQYAQAWHLKGETAASLTETVARWRDYPTRLMPLPHPSWRNNGWLKANPWFESELLPTLRKRVRRALSEHAA
jgi:uracil-DNA glycosylase